MCLRGKIEGIRLQGHITNKEVLNKVSEKIYILNIITRKRKNWIGLVFGGNNLLKELIEGRPFKKKKRGKLRQQMLDFRMGRKLT